MMPPYPTGGVHPAPVEPPRAPAGSTSSLVEKVRKLRELARELQEAADEIEQALIGGGDQGGSAHP